jgi:hypothetical protein
LGPISRDGFGYWWTCAVTVTTDDGRVIQTVVHRSIVTPADRGAKTPFRESCKRHGFKDCSYGRPVARGWKAANPATPLTSHPRRGDRPAVA